MINFRDREDFAPSVVSVLSIAVIVCAFGFMVFVKPPPPQAIASRSAKSALDLKLDIKKSTLAAIKSQAPIDQLTWSGDAENIGTTAMGTATALALKHGIKMTVFRTQNAVLVDNLVTLPYLVVVEGTFLGTLGFVRDLEDPKTKVAVTQIQISSSDPNTDKVTANIGIAAYVNPKEAQTIDTSSSSLQSRRDVRAPIPNFTQFEPARRAGSKVVNHA